MDTESLELFDILSLDLSENLVVEEDGIDTVEVDLYLLAVGSVVEEAFEAVMFVLSVEHLPHLGTDDYVVDVHLQTRS